MESSMAEAVEELNKAGDELVNAFVKEVEREKTKWIINGMNYLKKGKKHQS